MHRRDPDAAVHRRRYLDEQLAACRKLAAWLARDGRLAPAWTVEAAADMLFAPIADDVFARLIGERRWSRKRLGEKLALLLWTTFVTDAGAPPDGGARVTPRHALQPPRAAVSSINRP